MNNSRLLVFSLSFFALLFSGRSFADGFICYSDHLGLEVEINHSRNLRLGIRTQEEMTIKLRSAPGTMTKPFLHFSRELKNIAREIPVPGEGMLYHGQLLGTVAQSVRQIGPVPLRTLREVSMFIDYNFMEPVMPGARVSGFLILSPKAGEPFDYKMICHRTLLHPNICAKNLMLKMPLE